MSAADRIGVVGAGTMGAGIAQVAALGGFETAVHDPVLVAELRREQAAANEKLARHLTEERSSTLGERLRELAESAA